MTTHGREKDHPTGDEESSTYQQKSLTLANSMGRLRASIANSLLSQIGRIKPCDVRSALPHKFLICPVAVENQDTHFLPDLNGSHYKEKENTNATGLPWPPMDSSRRLLAFLRAVGIAALSGQSLLGAMRTGRVNLPACQ